MIDSATFIKTLNATDCNTTNAHAIGLSFPQKYNEVMFPSISNNDEYHFNATDVETGVVVPLRRILRPTNNQQHITGFTDYIRTKGLQCGDVLCLEKRTNFSDSATKTQYYLDVVKRENILILQKNKNGFIILRNDIGTDYFESSHDVLFQGQAKTLNIAFSKSDKRQHNSSTIDDFYGITLDNEDVRVFIKHSFIEIDTITNIIRGIDDVQFVIINQ